MPARLNVFVTVGMGPWPFDRLLAAVAPVCSRHTVFAQTGPSTVPLACESAPFLGWGETQRRIREADVVITHAGNTVRLAQRVGKVPIAVAREAGRGEMRNDHQVDYLAAERSRGRVVALDGPLTDLPAAVDRHPAREAELLARAAPLAAPDAAALARLLTERLTPAAERDAGDPFVRSPIRRYAWAFDQLRHRRGTHLDVGAGDETFARTLERHTALRVRTIGGHSGGLARLGPASVDSVSLLDTLAPAPDDAAMLREVARVVVPGGLVVVSVPARPVFSSTGRVPAELIALLDRCGFTVQARDGARLSRRFRPASRPARPDRALRRADLFLRAVRRDPAP